MKIALLLSRIEQTGVTTHTLDLAKGLLDEGNEVCIITGGKVQEGNARVNSFYDEFVKMGVQIHEFKAPEGGLIKSIYLSVKSTIKIITTLKLLKPDVIHAQSPYMTFIPWLMRKKFTTTIHNTKLVKNIKFKNPTHLIAISKESMLMSQKVFKIPKNEISIVNHGISKRFSKPISNKEKETLRFLYNIPKNKVLVGFVGRLTKEKGCDILCDAIIEQESTILSLTHYIFVGSTKDSKDHKWLLDNLESKGIKSNCTIIDFQDPKPFYDLFDIFILPSRFESFPLVILESMMSSCATVRSQVEGALEQIDDGVNGMLFPNEDVSALVLILKKLVTDEKFRLALANKGKVKALKEYTIPVMTKNTIRVYEKIKIS